MAIFVFIALQSGLNLDGVLSSNDFVEMPFIIHQACCLHMVMRDKSLNAMQEGLCRDTGVLCLLGDAVREMRGGFDPRFNRDEPILGYVDSWRYSIPQSPPSSFTKALPVAECLPPEALQAIYFCLSHRDVEELMLASRGLTTYEAVRHWCLKFGQAYANPLRRTPPSQARRQGPFMVYAILYDARLLRTGMDWLPSCNTAGTMPPLHRISLPGSWYNRRSC